MTVNCLSVNRIERSFFFQLFFCSSFTNCCSSLGTHTVWIWRCWWLILSRYDKQTNCSVPWAVCLSSTQTVVCRAVWFKTPPACFPFHQTASSKPWLHLHFYLSLSHSTLLPPHRLSRCVSSLTQRWARSVSLKRIRDISASHRGQAGRFSSLVTPPLPFSLRDQVLWFGQIKTSFMSVGTVSDYIVRPIVLVSLTNLPC